MAIALSEKSHEISESGAFVRQGNHFAAPFGSGPGELPVEAGSYRLIVSNGCPWAHRQLIALRLLGLEGAINNPASSGVCTPSAPISIGRVGPRTEKGWAFSPFVWEGVTYNPGGVDPVLGIRYLPEAYEKADAAYTGRATVPAVVDITTGKVVNNDYHRLTNHWETAWKPFHKAGAPDLYPEALRADIDALNQVLFDEVNNAVYKAGFAETQGEYEKAYDLLFNRLDILEERLGKQRYLFDCNITDSDIRLYVTLVRFDSGYYMAFKCNRSRIRDFPNLWNYAKDLYQTPGFGDTTDFETIKRGYQLINQGERNPYGIVSVGPDQWIWNEHHDRGRFGGEK